MPVFTETFGSALCKGGMPAELLDSRIQREKHGDGLFLNLSGMP